MSEETTTFVLDCGTLDNLNEALRVVSKAGYKAVSVFRTVEKHQPDHSVIIKGPISYSKEIQKVIRWANFPGLLRLQRLNTDGRDSCEQDLRQLTELVNRNG